LSRILTLTLAILVLPIFTFSTRTGALAAEPDVASIVKRMSRRWSPRVPVCE